MRNKTTFLLVAVSMLLLLVGALALPAQAQGGLTDQEQLGKNLFFDTNLSLNNNQACAACHAPSVGWTGPDEAINAHGAVYEGSVAGRFGNRKPPSAAYGGDSPILHFDGTNGVGGMFWDGRATGWTLQEPLAEQAQGPFLNPLEQALPNPDAVIAKVRDSDYAALFASECPGTDRTDLYNCIGYAIAAYESSSEVSSFTSKYDLWLQKKAKLTGQERLGMQLFFGKAKCANCHPGPLFTDFSYDNLGIPRNPENPFYDEPAFNPQGADWVDKGLGGFMESVPGLQQYADKNLGKFKAPTLRNVDKRPSPDFVKAYGHNGYFKSLEEIVHFYNTRDVDGAGWEGTPWPPPEYGENLNTTELGNLGLNTTQELAIVAFLRTLSDQDPAK